MKAGRRDDRKWTVENGRSGQPGTFRRRLTPMGAGEAGNSAVFAALRFALTCNLSEESEIEEAEHVG